MKPFDIYHANFYWRTRNYAGFFLLIRQDGSDWLCLGISSQDDKCEAFELPQLHPDFAATGLKHTSYVYDADPFSRIAVEKIGNRTGELRGQLLADFRNHSGF